MQIIGQMKARQPSVNTTAGTNSGAVATLTADTTKFNYVYRVIGWSDAASLVTISSDSVDDVEIKVEANKHFNIDLTGYRSSAINKAITATIAASTADCSISIIGEAIS